MIRNNKMEELEDYYQSMVDDFKDDDADAKHDISELQKLEQKENKEGLSNEDMVLIDFYQENVMERELTWHKFQKFKILFEACRIEFSKRNRIN